MLFALFLFFLAGFGVLQHVLAARAVILDGGLFKHYNKVSQALVGDDLCNAGKREIAQEVFAVHADCGGGKTKLIGGFLQAYKVGAFQVGAHHIPQAGDGNFLFVVQAHHGQTGSRTVGGIVLPDVGITHRCFLLLSRFIQTTPSCPAAPCLPHKATGRPADLTNEKTALLHGSLLTGGAPVCGAEKAVRAAQCLFHAYKLIKVYHIH